MISATSSATTSAPAGSAARAASATGAASEDRFLKLLVAQLSNQDPMNPMDNAQMTSQMAQISTVSSIEKVNDTLGSLAAQLSGLQMLQGGSLVGRSVLVEGDKLAINAGKAAGAISIDGRANSVKIDILSVGGKVIETIDLGQLEAGRHPFEWDASKHPGVVSASYRVTASNGGKPMAATPLVKDRVDSVSSENGSMHMQLQRLGSVSYSSIKAIL